MITAKNVGLDFVIRHYLNNENTPIDTAYVDIGDNGCSASWKHFSTSHILKSKAWHPSYIKSAATLTISVDCRTDIRNICGSDETETNHPWLFWERNLSMKKIECFNVHNHHWNIGHFNTTYNFNNYHSMINAEVCYILICFLTPEKQISNK